MTGVLGPRRKVRSLWLFDDRFERIVGNPSFIHYGRVSRHPGQIQFRVYREFYLLSSEVQLATTVTGVRMLSS